ncbi:mediator complex subunit 19 [Cotesia typhae]|uniref:mediator complex subunit 19 n=1 Tax=Cotesia typhae TaxID=2053667 RepID=UPI003D69E0F6
MMMGDQFRTKVEQYSPKSSPRGARSPVVSRQDSTGTLKTTISLGKNPSIVHSGPFYLMKEPPGESELTGATNLMNYYNLEHSYSKFSGKKLKEQLSSFLPNLPGTIDTPGHQDNSSLRSVIEKPPIGGKELLPLNIHQLSGFRLHPGPLPEQYRHVNQTPQRKHKNKHKKHKHKPGDVPAGQEIATTDIAGSDTHEKKHKKQKRHDEEKEARKKRKKEKKRKKQKHSPEHSGGLTPSQHSNS